MTVSPTSVAASATTTLTFTYMASATQPLRHGVITLAVPPGWTPPSQTSGPGYTTVTCPAGSLCQLRASPATGMVTIAGLDLGPMQAFTITYAMTTAPDSATTSTFDASEQSAPGALGTLTPLSAPPAVTVTCPDGAGTMTVSPSAMTASSTSVLTFTYVPGRCGLGAGGLVALTVPAGWTPPTAARGVRGYTTWSGAGPLSISGRTIIVPVASVGPGQTFSIRYMGTASSSPTSSTFDTSEQSAGTGTLTPLTASPTVTVTPSTRVTPTPSTRVTPTPSMRVTSSSPPVHPGSSGQMTVRPASVAVSRNSTLTFTYTAGADLAPSGEVMVQVPAGWTAPSATPGMAGYTRSSSGKLSVSGRRITVTNATLRRGHKLTITYQGRAAPIAADVSTFITSARPDGTARLAALALSPSVTVAPGGRTRGPAWLIILVAIGLAAVACAAGMLAFRRLPQDWRAVAGQSVRAIPHLGPPTLVAIADTGAQPTLTVRIEPHASAVITTIEESQQ